ncbi:hypothetical protein PR048_009312 [Dryococelus australis]|uniref:Uncharacterized protein n=1 Tax=Dryococelus australis TaxID=614101 RepID=A0ABQ9I1C9_9NEOP|nr:hypothetical protein PR048_009312 [Dryococelus australis]
MPGKGCIELFRSRPAEYKLCDGSGVFVERRGTEFRTIEEQAAREVTSVREVSTTRCHWSAGFLGDLPYFLPLHSGAATHSPHITFIGSPELESFPIKTQVGGAACLLNATPHSDPSDDADLSRCSEYFPLAMPVCWLRVHVLDICAAGNLAAVPNYISYRSRKVQSEFLVQQHTTIKVSIDVNGYDDSVDEVSDSKDGVPLAFSTHFSNEFPQTSGMKKAEGIEKACSFAATKMKRGGESCGWLMGSVNGKVPSYCKLLWVDYGGGKESVEWMVTCVKDDCGHCIIVPSFPVWWRKFTQFELAAAIPAIERKSNRRTHVKLRKCWPFGTASICCDGGVFHELHASRPLGGPAGLQVWAPRNLGLPSALSYVTLTTLLLGCEHLSWKRESWKCRRRHNPPASIPGEHLHPRGRPSRFVTRDNSSDFQILHNDVIRPLVAQSVCAPQSGVPEALGTNSRQGMGTTLQTKRTGFYYLRGRSQYLRMRESCPTMPLVSEFSRGPPVSAPPPPNHSGAAPYLTSLHRHRLLRPRYPVYKVVYITRVLSLFTIMFLRAQRLEMEARGFRDSAAILDSGLPVLSIWSRDRHIGFRHVGRQYAAIFVAIMSPYWTTILVANLLSFMLCHTMSPPLHSEGFLRPGDARMQIRNPSPSEKLNQWRKGNEENSPRTTTPQLRSQIQVVILGPCWRTATIQFKKKQDVTIQITSMKKKEIDVSEVVIDSPWQLRLDSPPLRTGHDSQRSPKQAGNADIGILGISKEEVYDAAGTTPEEVDGNTTLSSPSEEVDGTELVAYDSGSDVGVKAEGVDGSTDVGDPSEEVDGAADTMPEEVDGTVLLEVDAPNDVAILADELNGAGKTKRHLTRRRNRW